MKLLFSVLIFGLSVSYAYGQDSIRVPGYGSCEDGIQRAETEVSKRKFTNYRFGLIVYRTGEDFEFQKYYSNYMKTKYGIIVMDAGCIVSEESKCYTKRMRELVLEEFGPSIFERSKEEARKLFEAQNQD